MHFSTIFLPALFATLSAAQGTEFNYPCGNCGCTAVSQNTFVNGGSTIGQCIDLGAAAESVGLSGGSSFHCIMWTSTECTGTAQNVGIKTGQTFGCTDNQGGSFNSAQCFTDT